MVRVGDQPGRDLHCQNRRRRLGYGVFLGVAAVAALGIAVFLTRGKTAARAANMVAGESVPRVEVIVRPAKGACAARPFSPGR